MEFLALLLPILIDYITRKVSNSDARLWISVLVCSIFGVFLAWLNTGLHFVTPKIGFEIITNQIMIVFGLAQLSFHAVWSKTDTHNDLRPNA